jgi:arylsulfatase A-like enzyme
MPFLQGVNADRPHQTLYWRSGGYVTVLDGDWKLQVTERPDKKWLFDLKSDPTEMNNVAASNPDKVKELEAVIASRNAEMSKPLWPSLLEAPIHIDKPLGVPYTDKDQYIYWSN